MMITVLGMGGWVPHGAAFEVLQHSAYVRFSLLALSSIFFLVDPFAALPDVSGSDGRRGP